MWLLTRDTTRAGQPKESARLTCSHDIEDGKPTGLYLIQRIPYTDFPLPAIKLYLIDGVLMLPSEY